MTAATISSIDMPVAGGVAFSLVAGIGTHCGGNWSVLEPAMEAGGQMPDAVAAACSAANLC